MDQFIHNLNMKSQLTTTTKINWSETWSKTDKIIFVDQKIDPSLIHINLKWKIAIIENNLKLYWQFYLLCKKMNIYILSYIQVWFFYLKFKKNILDCHLKNDVDPKVPWNKSQNSTQNWCKLELTQPIKKISTDLTKSS